VHQLFLSQPTERLDRAQVIGYFLSLRTDDVRRVQATVRPRFEKLRLRMLAGTTLAGLSLGFSIFSVALGVANAAQRAAEMGVPNPGVGIERFVVLLLTLVLALMLAWQLYCVQRNIDVIDTACGAAEKANASRASTAAKDASDTAKSGTAPSLTS
jgi:hypothetical protein